MLYYYKYLDHHRIQTLHQFIEDFFEQMYLYNKKEFSSELLNQDFKPIADAYKDSLLTHLQVVFEEYKKLETDEQDKIYKGFKTNNDIQKLCKGEGDRLRYEDLSPGISTALKKLFYNLYEQILKRKEYCDRYGNQKEHFEEFCKLNKEAMECPFCGLTDLPSEYDSFRADYDHFLAKGIYPFNSVNFRNLVPMCGICNSKFKKQKNLLYRENNKKNRRKVFYPYDANPGEISIEIIIEKDIDIETGNDYKVEINGTTDTREEINTWDEIFEIKERYLAVIKKRSNSWIEMFKLEYKKWRKRGYNDFSEFINDTLEILAFKKFQDKAFLQKSYFEYLSADQEEFKNNLEETIDSGVF